MTNIPNPGDRGVKLISVRLPVDLASALTEDAKRRKRSVNAQINLLVEQHLEKEAA